MKKITTTFALILVLSFTLVSISEIGIVKADGTVYIRVDGTVEGTDVIQQVGDVYTFMGDLEGSIFVEKNDIIIDGAGYTLQGNGNGTGISLISITNVTIKSIEIKNFYCGIKLDSSLKNTISGNKITNNILGISFWAESNYNTISGNDITANEDGMFIYGSSNNITGNTITVNSGHGIDFYGSSNNITGNHIVKNGVGVYVNANFPFVGSQNNSIYRNNFINNTKQVSDILWESSFSVISVNIWDNGRTGNYWSDYTGTDANGDGIGDTDYIIDENNQDNCPLIAPIYLFDAGTWEWTQYNVYVVSNSTVSDFSFNPDEGALLRFDVDGEAGTTGFCRVTIPKDLLYTEGNWTVLVDGASVTPTIDEDASNTYLYFTYNHGTKTVEIIGTTAIPEFPSWTPTLLILIVLAVAVAIYKRKLSKTNKSTIILGP